MLARIGNVIYWAGCGMAALCVAVVVLSGILGVLTPGSDPAGAVIMTALYMVPIAILAYLTGRAAKYILAGI